MLQVLTQQLVEEVRGMREAITKAGEAESTKARETATLESPNDMLTIDEAADYANVSERTIRDWLKREATPGKPMLPNTNRQGHLIRIRKGDLAPWKKKSPQKKKPQLKPTRSPKRKRGKRKR